MYFHRYINRGVGLEEYVGHEIVGWRVSYRAWRTQDDPRRLQHFVTRTPSRYGALRAIVRRCRQWYGRGPYFLDVLDLRPICKAHYELVD